MIRDNTNRGSAKVNEEARNYCIQVKQNRKKGGEIKKAEIEANQFRLSNYIKIISNNFCR